jgi:hypothetical protein
VDHGGDFLLEIFHSPFCIGSGGWYSSDHGRVPHMLLYESDGASEFKGYAIDKGVNRDSISYLLELTRDIKHNPVRLTRLLTRMAKADLEYLLEWDNPLCIIDLQNIVEVVKRYCLGNDGTSHIRGSLDLALVLTKWRDRIGVAWSRFSELPEYAIRERIEPAELKKRCTQVIHGLMAPRVTRFGIQASRSIACARPVVADDAAMGWLRMHDDQDGVLRPRAFLIEFK